MPLNHTGPTPGESPARISAAQRGSGSTSTRVGGAAEHRPLHDRIQLVPEGGRLRLTVTRKYPRHTYFDLDELAYLQGLIGQFVSPVLLSRIEDRAAGR